MRWYEDRLDVNPRLYHFDWDVSKAVSNARKHGVTSEFAIAVFQDSQLLSVAELAHSGTESVGSRSASLAME